ncbi:MAG: hypothetical protein K8S16_10580 [Bacteroidales bacterium]|nr:hypothetical protein [Bacteroidales bacterium]
MLDLQTQLSKYLFWDVDITDIDYEKNAPYVVERVLDKDITWQIVKNRISKAVNKL